MFDDLAILHLNPALSRHLVAKIKPQIKEEIQESYTQWLRKRIELKSTMSVSFSLDLEPFFQENFPFCSFSFIHKISSIKRFFV